MKAFLFLNCLGVMVLVGNASGSQASKGVADLLGDHDEKRNLSGLPSPGAAPEESIIPLRDLLLSPISAPQPLEDEPLSGHKRPREENVPQERDETVRNERESITKHTSAVYVLPSQWFLEFHRDFIDLRQAVGPHRNIRYVLNYYGLEDDILGAFLKGVHIFTHEIIADSDPWWTLDLILSDCPSLEKYLSLVNEMGSRLYRVSFVKCRLTNFSLDAPQLIELNLSGNPLQELPTLHAPNLVKLTLPRVPRSEILKKWVASFPKLEKIIVSRIGFDTFLINVATL